MIVAGIDGTRTGWIVALLSIEAAASSVSAKAKLASAAPQARVTLHHLSTLSQLTELKASPKPRFVAIDMPLGLSSNAERGGRACDRAARAVLSAAAASSRGIKRKRSDGANSEARLVGASSIFTPPSRAALEAFKSGATHKAVSAANVASSLTPDQTAGLGLSIQSFHIMPKMRELDDFVRHTVGVKTEKMDSKENEEMCVVETHPEVGFLEMSRRREGQGSRALSTKKCEKGRVERLELLCDASASGPGISLQQLCTIAGLEAEAQSDVKALNKLAKLPSWLVDPLEQEEEKIRVPVDDILDALLCACTAVRLAHDEAESLPKDTAVDELVDAEGLPMRIWF